jgi:hypothetical protein
VNAIASLPARIATDLPNPDPVMPPGFARISDIMNWVMWGGFAFVIVGLIVLFASMARQGHRGDGEAGRQVTGVGWACVGAIGIGAAASIVGALS